MTAIELIKSHIPIVDALSRYVASDFNKARTSRERFNIRCPFHNDNSPSFTIYTDTNTFRCWSGCNEGKPGDVIDIVRLSQGLDTKEAINTLLNDYGLDNPDSEQMKEWQEKRAEQRKLSALAEVMNIEIIQAINTLKQIESLLLDKLANIENIQHLEQKGELYHLLPQLDYWLDCLIDNDIVTQFEALEEAKNFISGYESMVNIA